MARTYIAAFRNHPDFLVPKLHRVYYGWDHDVLLIHHWCKKHCQHGYYFSPGWQDQEIGKFVEFEDDHDATLFALRWS